MEDEGSGDMKIFSREKENKKVFNVHKSFFSSRFPVFWENYLWDDRLRLHGELTREELNI